MIGKESVRGITPSSLSACEGLIDRRGSKYRLSRAKICNNSHLTQPENTSPKDTVI